MLADNIHCTLSHEADLFRHVYTTWSVMHESTVDAVAVVSHRMAFVDLVTTAICNDA